MQRGRGAVLHNYFKTYEVEEPETHAVKILGMGSYWAAGLLGSLYVLVKGFVSGFLVALAIDAACVAVGVVVAAAISSQLEAAETVITFCLVAAMLCVARSVPIVALVKNGYRDRGWMVTRV
jgi:hypothetical protein